MAGFPKWLIVALGLALGLLLYRGCFSNRHALDVTPDASREIEKAKKR